MIQVGEDTLYNFKFSSKRPEIHKYTIDRANHTMKKEFFGNYELV